MIKIIFPKDWELIALLKEHTKPKWSNSQKVWYVPDTPHYRKLFSMPQKNLGKESMGKISDNNLPEFRRFEEHLILKGFSPNTQRTYCTEFAQLLHCIGNFPVQNLSPEKLRSYILYCHKELNLSENQIHSRMNALKFYFEKVLGREKMFFDIPRPKKPQLLPKYLTQDEIKKIINATENQKHRLIIQLGYGMGLRVSEIVNLKIEDIDSQNMRVFISRAKGKKDRYVNLPESTLAELRVYYKTYRPKDFLFEGKYSDSLSIRSAQAVFKTAMTKAGISKRIGIHGLRHSYATHLLEYGTDVSLIQKLLGHNNIKTTLLYTNVSEKFVGKVQSPLDRI
ncbi:MAG: tyrosine-type recombinase/integrase [Cruoricaptor ignavus]|nr:tyrosine-type recombinase/integrase [Cruoricaptor ignavus]